MRTASRCSCDVCDREAARKHNYSRQQCLYSKHLVTPHISTQQQQTRGTLQCPLRVLCISAHVAAAACTTNNCQTGRTTGVLQQLNTQTAHQCMPPMYNVSCMLCVQCSCNNCVNVTMQQLHPALSCSTSTNISSTINTTAAASFIPSQHPAPAATPAAAAQPLMCLPQPATTAASPSLGRACCHAGMPLSFSM